MSDPTPPPAGRPFELLQLVDRFGFSIVLLVLFAYWGQAAATFAAPRLERLVAATEATARQSVENGRHIDLLEQLQRATLDEARAGRIAAERASWGGGGASSRSRR